MATDLQTILELTVPVIVQLGERQMSCEEVLALGPGAIIELDRSASDELDLLVNNRQVGKGVAIKIGENFGIRVSSIGTPEQRIEAMGG